MDRYLLLTSLALFAGLGVAACAADQPAELRFKEDFLRRLAAAVPDILKQQDPKTGRFGSGIFIVGDQNVIFPLAAAWATKAEGNPYYHDSKLLEAIMAGGDALIDDMLPDGQWVFRKKDGSTWGNIYMPWTYSRWIRAFSLVREGMPADRRKRWEDALRFGYGKIAEMQLRSVGNINTHHAMALYLAGQVFERPEWCQKAKEFMAKVVAAQSPAGFWSEHCGPVVGYGFVYVDALGHYYALSHDESVLPALKRAAEFHAICTYPDGARVETVDERSLYHSGIAPGNVGLSYTPDGRAFLARQWALLEKRHAPLSSDDLASCLLYGQEGPTAAVDEKDSKRVLSDHKAMTWRKAPWFVCLSAYACPISKSRWHQDRQNLVSIFHDTCGLIIGGGNTKLQPLWSTFTVGDVSLLKHTPGEQNPTFEPAGTLFHIPSAATLKATEPVGLELTYGEEQCAVEVEPVDDTTLTLRLRATAKSGLPVAAHLTLMPHLGKAVTSEKGTERKLGDESFTLTSEEAGAWIAHAGWRLTLPPGSSVTWPALPHNPYRKDGSATTGEGRLVVTIPFSAERGECVLTLTVGA